MQASNEHAWWLPPGSIRAALALAIIAPTVAVLAVNAQYELLLSIAVIAVNFYFLKDNISGKTASDEQNEVRVDPPQSVPSNE